MTFGTSDLGRGATHDGARVHGCTVLGFAPLLTPVLSPHLPSHRLRSPSPPSVVTQFLSCGAWESESFPVPFQSPRARARPNISCPSETPEGKAGTAERMDGEVGRKPTAKADGLAKHDAITDRRDQGEKETRSTSDSNNIDMRRKIGRDRFYSEALANLEVARIMLTLHLPSS